MSDTVGITIGRGGIVGLALLLAGCALTPAGKPDQEPVPPVMPAPPVQSNGAIYQEGRALSLFADVRARRVGDILTIVLTEKTDATKKASTSTKKENDVSVSEPTIFGRSVTRNGDKILGATLESSQEFSGEGESNQSNSLTGNITVTVVQVLPNGNLVVRGEKRLVLNQGEEHLRISGIVRPVDIRPDNTVLSTQVADARITYSGRGAVADANQLGWLSRFFLSVIWPF